MKRYPHYKDSGVSWLGEIPEHWETARIKHIVLTPVTDGPHETPEFLADGIPFISAESIKNNAIDFSRKRGFISLEDHHKYSRKYKPRKNDIYIVKSGATTGNVAIVETNEEFNIWSPLAVMRANNALVLPKFAFYFVQSAIFRQAVESKWSFGTQQNIGMGVIENIAISLPPIEEQAAICQHLSDQTAVLDTLITKKQQLIELLREERTAVINAAVTGQIDTRTEGLVGYGRYKDSGIDWLGPIPEHWEIIKLKFLAQIKYGLGQPPRQMDGGIPLIRATNIEKGKITESGMIYVDPTDVPYQRDPLLETNDIIVVRSGVYTGDSAIIPEKYSGAITGYDMVVRVIKVEPQFVAHALLSNYVLIDQLYLLRLRAAQPHLNAEELGETLILIPPENERIAIVAYLDRKTNQIDQSITTVERQICLLQEYRTALISAAVTGQIDVRQEEHS